jgi:hypothetical protein
MKAIRPAAECWVCHTLTGRRIELAVDPKLDYFQCTNCGELWAAPSDRRGSEGRRVVIETRRSPRP